MNLKEIRKKKGISQKKIAEILNISQTQMYRIESGISAINSDHIVKLCNFLKVSADELLGIKSIEEQAKEIKEKYNTNLTLDEIIHIKETLEKSANYINKLIKEKGEENERK